VSDLSSTNGSNGGMAGPGRRRRRRLAGRAAGRNKVHGKRPQVESASSDASRSTDIPQQRPKGAEGGPAIQAEDKPQKKRRRKRRRRTNGVDIVVAASAGAGLPNLPGEQASVKHDSTQTPIHHRNRKHVRVRNDATELASRKPPATVAPRAYAALDLGTNNCRLLIAVPRSHGRFRVIDGFSRIVRLGEGLEATGQLSEGAMKRAIGALEICAEKLQNHSIRRARLIATEACRRASNGDMFLEHVKQRTGLDLEVVDRHTEACLAAEGCGPLIDRTAHGAVLFDIGGGSSELVLVDRGRTRSNRVSDQIAAWTSLPMGVVTLAEKFSGVEVTRESFAAMTEHVLDHLKRFEQRHVIDHLFEKGRVHLLGTSGTVTTLAGIHLQLERYDRRKVDGQWLDNRAMDAVIERLLSMNYAQRSKEPCIGTERADLVLAGCAILNAIRRIWPAPRLRVADRGLREGLLTGMMNADRRRQRVRSAKRRERAEPSR